MKELPAALPILLECLAPYTSPEPTDCSLPQFFKTSKGMEAFFEVEERASISPYFYEQIESAIAYNQFSIKIGELIFDFFSKHFSLNEFRSIYYTPVLNLEKILIKKEISEDEEINIAHKESSDALLKHLKGNVNDCCKVLKLAIEFGSLGVFYLLVDHVGFLPQGRITQQVMTIMGTAVKHGQFEMLKYLIETKALPVPVDLYESLRAPYLKSPHMEDTSNVFFLAIEYGQRLIVKYFLENQQQIGLNPFAWDGSAMYWAAYGGDVEIVKCLVENGADINVLQTVQSHHQQGTQMISPIQLAVYAGNIEVIKYLLDQGSFKDLNALLRQAFISIFKQSSQDEVVEAIQYLVEKKSVDVHTFFNFELGLHDLSKFLKAPPKKQLRVIKYLLEDHKVDLNLLHAKEDSMKGIQLLGLAVLWNQFEVIKYLIEEKQANVNEVNTYRDLCWHNVENRASISLAIDNFNGNPEIINFLLANGADVEQPLKEGYTILHQVIFSLNEDTDTTEKVIKNLIEKGEAIINAANEKGVTPFLLAIQSGKLNIARYLFEAGADIRRCTPLNFSFLHYCVKSLPYFFMQVTSMENYTKKQEEAFSFIRMLLDTGEGIEVLNLPNHEGNTPLHFAAQQKHADFVRLLLEYDADINVYNHQGKTPFDLAKESNRSEEIISLLEGKNETQQPRYF